MKRIKEQLNKNKILWLAVVVIFVAGIFFRTYKFHELMRFNSDQGRDSELVSNVIDGKDSIPLLGPKAGGTAFKLGPMFYYFQIASAYIFGNYADKMAYPDLITSILSIGLLYFFLRKYFDFRISIAMSMIFAVSQFAVRWSRFAWNPNSTPFWTLIALYSLHEVATCKNNRNRLLWSILAGVSMGIGVQLHSMLLFFLPITLFFVFIYLYLNKINIFKNLLIIGSMVLILNIPQFIYEYSSNGENTRAFIDGVRIKQSGQGSIVDNIIHGNSAIVQIFPNILTGYEISDDFSVDFKNYANVITLIFGSLFTIGGLTIAIKYYKKENDIDKKIFLTIIGIYSIVAYLIFIKLSFETSVRMYLVVFFIPFMLLGFWLNFFIEKLHKHKKHILLGVTIIFMVVNLFFITAYFAEFENYASGNGSVNISTLGEMEKFAKFIADNSKGENKVYISGNKKFFFINYSPIRYLVSREGKEAQLIGSKEINSQSIEKYFYVSRENKLDDVYADSNYSVVQKDEYGKFTILLLKRK